MSEGLFTIPDGPPPPEHAERVATAPADLGLELPQLTAAPSALAQAVDATLSQLVTDEHLDPVRDAARIALARELAAVIAGKRTTGKASTVGNDARVLLDLLDGMVPTEAATSADAALANAMREWTAHIESQGAASGD